MASQLTETQSVIWKSKALGDCTSPSSPESLIQGKAMQQGEGQQSNQLQPRNHRPESQQQLRTCGSDSYPTQKESWTFLGFIFFTRTCWGWNTSFPESPPTRPPRSTFRSISWLFLEPILCTKLHHFPMLLSQIHWLIQSPMKTLKVALS